MPRENIIPSVIAENPIATLNKSLNTLPCLEESGPNPDPFSGFPSLDSSDERTMSHIEALLDNPRGLSYTFEDNIVEPPVQIDILPEILVPDAVSAVDYQFPSGLLTDGLHPSVQFAKDIWTFLHKSISEVHDKITGRKIITAPLSSPVASIKGNKNTTFKAPSYKRSKQHPKQPYMLRKIKLSKEQSSVHSRLSQPPVDNEEDEALEEESVGHYSNLSWKASTSRKSQSATKVSPIGYIQKSQPWSWAQHNQRINDVKVEVYTQGLESQKRAEGRLADIIRDRGLKLAEQGQFDTVNAASRCWLTNLHAEMNSPAPGAKLVQKEIAELLPVEEDKTSSDTD
ncbi:unnamed protein product [Rotaria magnacalcarata]|uniref:Uncharacterized protein n=1 Tax=Rotaria magnacalcarata TaxID=392030 RepID=A0A816Q9J6_9BILA|nr:unnamed protein product [Rotaria magnacalcarata]CAF4203674.1 unnamed protein product [Rotaria magnacalcarata]